MGPLRGWLSGSCSWGGGAGGIWGLGAAPSHPRGREGDAWGLPSLPWSFWGAEEMLGRGSTSRTPGHGKGDFGCPLKTGGVPAIQRGRSTPCPPQPPRCCVTGRKTLGRCRGVPVPRDFCSAVPARPHGQPQISWDSLEIARHVAWPPWAPRQALGPRAGHGMAAPPRVGARHSQGCRGVLFYPTPRGGFGVSPGHPISMGQGEVGVTGVCMAPPGAGRDVPVALRAECAWIW